MSKANATVDIKVQNSYIEKREAVARAIFGRGLDEWEKLPLSEILDYRDMAHRAMATLGVR